MSLGNLTVSLILRDFIRNVNILELKLRSLKKFFTNLNQFIDFINFFIFEYFYGFKRESHIIHKTLFFPYKKT